MLINRYANMTNSKQSTNVCRKCGLLISAVLLWFPATYSSTNSYQFFMFTCLSTSVRPRLISVTGLSITNGPPYFCHSMIVATRFELVSLYLIAQLFGRMKVAWSKCECGQKIFELNFLLYDYDCTLAKIRNNMVRNNGHERYVRNSFSLFFQKTNHV